MSTRTRSASPEQRAKDAAELKEAQRKIDAAKPAKKAAAAQKRKASASPAQRPAKAAAKAPKAKAVPKEGDPDFDPDATIDDPIDKSMARVKAKEKKQRKKSSTPKVAKKLKSVHPFVEALKSRANMNAMQEAFHVFKQIKPGQETRPQRKYVLQQLVRASRPRSKKIDGYNDYHMFLQREGKEYFNNKKIPFAERSRAAAKAYNEMKERTADAKKGKQPKQPKA